MNLELGLRTLSEIMSWTADEATEEFEWIRFMSVFKYDEYRDYIAGSRFIESLARWLQQFKSKDERRTAYRFLKSNIVYIGDAEMQRLIEAFFPDVVFPSLLATAATRLSIQDYEVLQHPDGPAEMRRALQSTLFMALSDGARIDAVRRTNYRRVRNDQVYLNARLDRHQWNSALANIRTVTGDCDSLIQCVYLIDDFTASGTTFCRFDPIDEEWQGKLIKFHDSFKLARNAFAPDFHLRVHHLIGTEQAGRGACRNNDRASVEVEDWFPNVSFSFGMTLASSTQVTDDRFLQLSDVYYDRDLETSHTRRSGVQDMKRGYGGCALPLVLSHNTPNNSLPLLWAETAGTAGHAMRPLFRRRQRHS
jgi:hypothetical protein